LQQKSIHTQDYRRFLEVLRRARKKAGLTQVQLAERIGRTQSAVSKVERGERRLDVIELRILCEAMGVSLAEFVQELEEELR
jgi:transcriptional regulator with XRE-family HTH domain